MNTRSTKLQITSIIRTVPAKGSKPRTWGFYRERGSAPSSCKVTTFTGDRATVRVVK